MLESGVLLREPGAETLPEGPVHKPEIEQRSDERLGNSPQPLVAAQTRTSLEHTAEGLRRVHAQRGENVVACADDQFMFQRSFHCA